MLKRLAQPLLALFYPPVCAVCGAAKDDPGLMHGVCTDCWNAVQSTGDVVCTRCGKPIPSPEAGRAWRDFICAECRARRRTPYSMLRSLYSFASPIREMIHLFKFDGMTAVGEEFARRLAEAAVEAGVFDSVDLVVPVPLHYRRWIERGFNQSEVLSRRVAERLGKPHSGSALVRTRHTPPQSRLEPEERLRNLRGAFTARKEQVKGLTVLLVDDVTTTEATVRECAVALRRARAREIRILTLARAIQG